MCCERESVSEKRRSDAKSEVMRSVNFFEFLDDKCDFGKRQELWEESLIMDGDVKNGKFQFL